jgi:hypothetical protein
MSFGLGIGKMINQPRFQRMVTDLTQAGRNPVRRTAAPNNAWLKNVSMYAF